MIARTDRTSNNVPTITIASIASTLTVSWVRQAYRVTRVSKGHLSTGGHQNTTAIDTPHLAALSEIISLHAEQMLRVGDGAVRVTADFIPGVTLYFGRGEATALIVQVMRLAHLLEDLRFVDLKA